MKNNGRLLIRFAAACLIGATLAGCSCETRLARLEAKCGPVRWVDTIMVPVQVYRDSIRIDTVIQGLPDTLILYEDSLMVVVIRDTVLKRTTVHVDRPGAAYTVSVPVAVEREAPATWRHWRELTWLMAGRLSWLWGLLMIAVFVMIVFRFFRVRR